MQKQVVITVESDGAVVIDAQNFKGKGCASATQGFELLLTGGNSSDVDSKKKPDYFATHTGAGQIKN